MSVNLDQLFRDVPLAQHATYPILVRKRIGFFIEEIERFRLRSGKGKEDLRILDVACGVGKIAFPLAHLQYHVFGLDNGEQSLEYLKKHNRYSNFEPFLFDLEREESGRLPEQLDVIIVASILEHLTDPVGVLGKLLRRASSSCLVLGEVPNCYGASELAHSVRRKVARRFGHTTGYRKLARALKFKGSYDASDSVTLTDTPHVYGFNHRRLREILGAKGLQDIRIENANFLTGTPVLHKVLLLGREPMQKLDIGLSKWLPGWLGNGWFFSGVR